MPVNIPIYEIPEVRKGGTEYGFKIFQLKGKKQELLSTFPRETHIPHRHPFYEICFFIQGSGESEMDFHRSVIHSPGLHFIGPGRVHRIEGDAESLGYVIAFTREFFCTEETERRLLDDAPFFKANATEPAIILKEDDFSYFRSIMENMVRDYLYASSHTESLLRAWLKILLIRSVDLYRQQTTSPNSAEIHARYIVEKFQQLLENHYETDHQVGQYASRLSITPDHLNRLTRQALGKKASEMILDRIILEIKRLLLFSNLNAKEIAYRLNFSDPSYFGRIFRKKTGHTPSSFRAAMQEKYQL
ncbi:MAG: AraC family transcriptional regulator [Bacteroidia bacterium]|nr:AraC family transcriptional regulator [Bacteroidia bacterium]